MGEADRVGEWVGGEESGERERNKEENQIANPSEGNNAAQWSREKGRKN